MPLASSVSICKREVVHFIGTRYYKHIEPQSRTIEPLTKKKYLLYRGMVKGPYHSTCRVLNF